MDEDVRVLVLDESRLCSVCCNGQLLQNANAQALTI
jgi:hypothetical protein